MNIRSASLLTMALSLWANAHAVSPQATKPDAAQARQALQGLTVPFEANNGQFDERVAFAGKTFAGAVYITRQGQIVYSLPAPKEAGSQAWSLTETLVDAAPLKPYGGEQAQTKISRFTGPQSYQAATYHNVQLGQAWPGIEVELAARGSNVEKLFHVKPHADAQRIQVRLDGAESLRVGEAGELIAKTGHGDVAYTAPIAFQEVGGKRIDVPVKYALNEAGDGYGFALGMYDRTRALVIDPLLQSTYLGGSGMENLNAIAIDQNTGDVLVGGGTFSPDFPGTAGGAQAGYGGGGGDVFVSRLSGDLKMLRQSTYLGGAANEAIGLGSGGVLVIDPKTGDVLVTGRTDSTDFPGTAGGAQAGSGGGGDDGFIARLSGDLKTLRQSSYLGGGLSDEITSLAIDAVTGDVLAMGRTESLDFPGTAGGAQPGAAGGYSGFVARLSGDLKMLRQSTYLGGGRVDNAFTFAIDATTGDVLVAGDTNSADFPGMVGGAQPTLTTASGDSAGFVSRLSGDLKTLRQSTYLGGSQRGNIYALAVDVATGDVLVAGDTGSVDFPGTVGGMQPGWSGSGQMGYVSRLTGDLKTLRQSTYLGGWWSIVFSLAIDAATDDVLAAGIAIGSDFPGTAGGAQPDFGGALDGFVARLSGNLKVLRQSTYLGVGDTDILHALALDTSTGDVLVAGDTSSVDFPGTVGGAQPGLAGFQNGFVARLSGDLKAISPQKIIFPAQASQGFVAGGSFSIDPLATASSGLPVSYASSTPSVCTVAGSVVTMVSAGTCTVVASQPGNAQWLPATNVAQDIAIQPPPIAAQNITFPAQADQDFVAGGSFAIDPAATASSGLPVSYTSSTPGVCTVSGNVVTMVAAGTCTVVASQGGNAEWAPAQDVAASMVLADNSGSVKPPEPPLPGQVTPVPVLGPFGLALMSLLAGGLGWLQLRRRAA
ncbi:IPTL-CTERM sorting domain-containing protein [Pseudomonas chlororaphis]|uniref:IPTL-CTERM sorting domain-containing protein n=1 Tax=Pseudomonas chlororaphis TaxID=587753 RepID=UPI00046EA038|nr:IPTL-CTERM sorting domain-containing protein [Pseudomonas chlororaphis]